MAELCLLIGEEATSAPSLQLWLAMRQVGLRFETRPYLDDFAAELAPGTVAGPPVLLVDEVPIWGVAAVAEFLAEHVTGLWPSDPRIRAEARSIAYEALEGFGDLRAFWPFDLSARFTVTRLIRPVERDLRRLIGLWALCRERYASGGPFLFGSFTLADAMHVPLVLRLARSGIRLEGPAEAYVRTIGELPAVAEWVGQVSREPTPSGAAHPMVSQGPPEAGVMPHRAGSPVDHGEEPPAADRTTATPPPTAPLDGTIKPIGAGTRRRH